MSENEERYNAKHEFIVAEVEYKTPEEIKSTEKVESEEKKALRILFGEEK